MGAVNFYLKKKEPSTGRSLIYLSFLYSGIYKLIFSFGQTIEPKDWNKKKQRVKSNTQTTADGIYSLNDMLDRLEETLKHAYYAELKNGIPTPQVLKRHLLAFVNQNKVGKDTPTLYKLIERFTGGDIKHKGGDKSSATITKYKTTLSHLKAFELATRYRVDFDTINLDFFYKFVTYLKGKGQAQNTIAKNIDIVKTFMNEAVDLGYTSNLQYKSKKFTVQWEESEAVYLTESEVMDLYHHDFSLNKRLEGVRDLFVFGCFVGLRYSDYSDVKPQNIRTIDGEKFISLVTRKTGEQVVIPCSPVVLQIFEKYKDSPNNLPKSLTNQKFNEYIKEVCKEAGLTEAGRLSSEPEKALWECVSSHTARRSFATNLYLEGYPTLEIMKITGHRTEKAFLTYIKVSKLDAAKRLSKHMKLRWSEKLLKVA